MVREGAETPPGPSPNEDSRFVGFFRKELEFRITGGGCPRSRER